jgi:DNA mismatch repair protein MutL
MQQEDVSKIRLLPEHVIDRIKAGEVVERPAHIVKELIENSLDAKSTKIEIIITGNGLDSIEIKDNGVGIAYEDLPLAFARHATSKLNDFDDLYRLYTFGFRGEALASLSSVSKITCLTKTENEVGARLYLEGPQILSHIKEEVENIQSGTHLIIRDLFFNTPARLKFMSSEIAEMNYIKKIIYSYILGNPQVEFTLKMNHDDKLFYQSRESATHRFQDVTKQKMNLKHNLSEYGRHQVDFFISEQADKSRKKYQYVFVNNRPIYDKKIMAMINNLAAKYWGEGKTGHYLVYLNCPTESLDVNIHPHKTVVKFENSAEVFALIRSACKACLHNEVKEVSAIAENNNRDESQAQESFELKQDVDLAESSSFFQPRMDFEKTSEVFKVNESLYIINLEGVFYLQSSQEIIKKLFERSVDSTPLLISLPFQVKNKETVSILRDFHFDFDFVSENEVLLREIPSELNYFSFQNFLEKALNQNKINIYDKELLNTLSCQLSDTDILNFSKGIGRESLVEITEELYLS